MADKVFEDRLGVIVVDAGRGRGRLQGFKALGVRDVFLPRNAQLSDLGAVRNAGLYAHMHWSVDDDLRDNPEAFADRVLGDIARLRPGAGELNIELPSDEPLPQFIRRAVTRIRARRGSYRLRINVAPWKAFALPIDLLQSDPNLYACEQNYLGNMLELLSAEDVAADMRAWGVPDSKITVCYAAHCQVLGSSARVRALPDLSRRKRGVIYQDDLMADAGLL